MKQVSFLRLVSVVIIIASFFFSCKKEIPIEKEVIIEETSVSSENYMNKSQSLPDVTKEFDKIIKETKKRCEELKSKWPISEKTFRDDLNYLLTKRNDIEILFNLYYGNLKTWQNLLSRINYIKGHFKDKAPGDIKRGIFKKYNSKNGGKVIYKGKVYSVEALGNINFGIGCKAIGFPYLFSACAAGCYQLLAEECLKPSTKNAKKLLTAIQKAVANNKLKGKCFDYPGDSRWIKIGYTWY